MSFSAFASFRSRWMLGTGVALLSGVGAHVTANTRPKIRLDSLQKFEVDEDEIARQLTVTGRLQQIRSATAFCDFADSSPSVYHAVDTVKKHLLSSDFTEIQEKDTWIDTVKPGGRYFVSRSGSSGSSIIAFAVGSLWQPGNPFAMVATHIDSPCLKLKPLSYRSGSGFEQIGVETYGGGLWHTWFDRDLGVAGRAFVRTGPTTVESMIVQIDEPILRVPSLAVHLDHQNPFKFNTETNLIPIAGQNMKSERPPAHTHDRHGEELSQIHGPFPYEMSAAGNRHNRGLVNCLAEKLDVHPDSILDFDLSLYDTQKATLGGLDNEFIFSARIDNLMMSYCALNGFTNSLNSRPLEEEASVRLLVMFDHEEIGSVGPIGAQSSFLPSTLQRLSSLRVQNQGQNQNQNTNDTSQSSDSRTAYSRAIARSFMISADMTQALHPNYSHFHESTHRPALNGGIVFTSTSRRYLAKNTPGMVMLSELICKIGDNEVPPKTQFWVAMNGHDCGSTVGPHLESRLGARTIDLGNAALSMHSIREMAGTYDVSNGVRFLQAYYENYSDFEEWVKVE